MTFSSWYESKVDEQTTYHNGEELCYGEPEYFLIMDNWISEDLYEYIDDDERWDEFLDFKQEEGFYLSNMDGIDTALEWLGQIGPVEINLYKSFDKVVEKIEAFFIDTLVESGVDEEEASEMVNDPYGCDVEIDDDVDERWTDRFCEYLD